MQSKQEDKNMRKITSLCLALCLILSAMAGLVACTNQTSDPQDTQATTNTLVDTNADDTQASDSTDTTSQVQDTQAQDATEAETQATSTAAVTKEEVAKALGSASEACMTYLAGQNTAAVKYPSVMPLANVDASQWIPEDAPEFVMACVWYMEFLRNVCTYDNGFVMSEEPTYGHIAETVSEANQSTYKTIFNFTYDKETKNVLAWCYVYDIPHDTHHYFEFNVFYDFDTDTMTEFTMGACLDDDIFCYRYVDGTLYRGTPPLGDYQAMAQKYAGEPFDDTKSLILSKEYNDANPYVSQ